MQTPDPSADDSATLRVVGTILALTRRTREAVDAAELRFIIVNETLQLVPYRQAVLWLAADGVAALSGVSSIEGNAPLVLWLNRILPAAVVQAGSHDPRAIGPADLNDADATDWAQWLPAHGLWIPLRAARPDRIVGGLLLLREEPWRDHEAAVVREWTDAWSYAYEHATARSPLAAWRARLQPPADSDASVRAWLYRRRLAVGCATLAVILLFPVRLTVLAPGELVPRDPSIIRSPLDGIIERVLVVPNQPVTRGQPLFEFDRANIQSRLAVARQALASTSADYRIKAQRALFDPESKSQLAVAESQIAEKRAEVDYLERINQRGVVDAPRAGLALFDDATEWVGRPVTTGERIMVVADATAVEVEAWLSPWDAIELPPGRGVTLYLNSAPLDPVHATLRYVSHEATERPDGTYAYRVRADVTAATPSQRVGLKGVAKMEGGRVALVYWVFRRPLASLRGWLGL